MDRLDTMRLYARIVELGSFTAAANDLDLPRATVTHAIKKLEARLGAQLLQRTTRCQRITRDGQAYYAHCVRLLADLDEVEADFREAALKPQGRLRIDLPATLARQVVIPALPEFCARFPLVELDIGTSDRFVDLLREGVDCVLRVGELPDSGLVGRRVAMLAQATVASAGYLRRHGKPILLADLQQGHLAVNWASPTTRRLESSLEFVVNRRRREVHLPSRVTVSGVDAYLACCEAGLGIAQFPRYRVADSLARGTLREILPDLPPPTLSVHVLYAQQQMPARLRVFVDWLVELMERQA
ncbi:LysR family transcriptional regulator [Rhodanobacter hydrolyticus]|uniref:LysR family transcriptional regulator n=1 Tax=Rhodanobacter hydrolyticus TaxID=2250595 RepID=A0ABW8J6J5_9GAMM